MSSEVFILAMVMPTSREETPSKKKCPFKYVSPSWGTGLFLVLGCSMVIASVGTLVYGQFTASQLGHVNVREFWLVGTDLNGFTNVLCCLKQLPILRNN